MVEGEVLVGFLFRLVLLVFLLVVGVVEVGLFISLVRDETVGFSVGRLEADGALVTRFVPCLGAGVGDASGNAENREEGEREEEHHYDAESDEVFIHGCGLKKRV